jgi:hypothetical protein
MTLVNLGITLVVNGVYVISINRGYNSTISFFISVSLSLFKIGYHFIVVIFKVEMGDKYVLFLSLVNNLIVPYFAEMFVSPDCFYYAVTIFIL